MTQPWERALLLPLATGHGIDMGCGHTKIGPFGIDNHEYPGVDLVCDMAHVPLPSNSQDYITACHSLEHCADTTAVLREWHRLLRPGGIVAAIVPNGDLELSHILGDSTGAHKSLFTIITLPKFFRYSGFAIDRDLVRGKSLYLLGHKP